MKLFEKKRYNILVLGSDGMLGHDVYEAFKSESARKNSNVGTVVGISKDDGFQLHSRHALSSFLLRSIHFDYCINCVAYTDTNAAETTKDGRRLSYELNALTPKYIAESCRFNKTKLIHISTDYVFSEFIIDAYPKFEKMFRPNDEPFPVNEYGKDKLLGEFGVIEEYGKNEEDFAILRTSWLYGMHNNKSFVHKFLKNVVMFLRTADDSCVLTMEMTENEKSVPTSTKYLVECIKEVIQTKRHGILHAVPLANDYGVTRMQFAQAILDDLRVVGCDSSSLVVNDFNICDMNLTSVMRNGLQPQYSALANTVGPCTYWDYVHMSFMKENYEQLLKYIDSLKHIEL